MLKSGGCIYSRIDKNLCYNKTMSKIRHGFTLIEVALFLAVTGLLFVGVMVGVQNSIWQQRYNDTVQNFTNFLRNVYSEVSNPQSLGNGRSDRAIYGKLISFGQRYGLDGEELGEEEQKIYVYDVVGDADASKVGTGSVTEMLAKLNANVVIEEESGEDDGVIDVTPAGIVESYSPVWGSVVEMAKKEGVENTDNNLYEGSILIARHPKSGTVNTLVSDTVINVNETLENARKTGIYADIDGLLIDNLDTFELEDADFCVNPYGIGEKGTMKRNIRIVKNARNSSGVEMVDLDGDESNKCSD